MVTSFLIFYQKTSENTISNLLYIGGSYDDLKRIVQLTTKTERVALA